MSLATRLLLRVTSTLATQRAGCWSAALTGAAVCIALSVATSDAQDLVAAVTAPDGSATQQSVSIPMPDATTLSGNLNLDVEAPLPANETNLPTNMAGAQTDGPTIETANSGGAVASIPRRFHYTFGIAVAGTYDDNINVSHFFRTSDFYLSIEPRVSLGFGDVVGRRENYLRLDYTPSLQIYTEHSDLDAFQQIARLEGQYRINRLSLSASQEVQILDSTYYQVFAQGGSTADQVNVDVSTRTRLNLFNTNVGASYDLSGKTYLSAGLGYSISDYDVYLSSRVFSGNVFMNYRYSDKLVIGLGGSGGRIWVDRPNPDETVEQAGIKLIYNASGKLDFIGNAAVEFRQIDDSDHTDFVTPVFDASAVYRPFDGTKVTLNTSRRTLNSAVLAGEDYNIMTIGFDVKQRFMRRFTLGLALQYQNLDYFSTGAFPNSGRRDNYYSARPSLDVALTRFWTVGAFYLRSQNDSSLKDFTFYDNQIGLRTSLSF